MRKGWPKGVPIPEHVKEKIRKKLMGRHSCPRTEFKKGHVPWNKGIKKKGQRYAYHNISSTKFKKGQRPLNWKPVGTVSVRRRKDGRETRRFIKVAEPNIWIIYARYIWEKTRGRKIPRGFVIYHQDGNRLNDDPRNLVCIGRALNLKFLMIDRPDLVQKARKGSSDALKKRWEQHKKANGICVI